ncbi:MAG: hypothetical protein AAF340_08035 [Pseudomonadota bacterium]
MTALRFALFSVLTGALVLMAGTTGHARVAANGHTIVICSDGALLEITVNAEGEPIAPRSHCPDCLPKAQAVLLVAGLLPLWQGAELAFHATPLDPSRKQAHRPHAVARGPPSLSV